MRIWLAVLGALLLLLVLSVVVAEGRDNTGETVRPERWADDVCDTVGAWEGQLEVIADQIDVSSVAVRRHDGGSGDEVEGTVTVRDAVDRAIQATEDTLQEGLTRAGSPDVADGEEASSILDDWARQTERRLHAVRAALEAAPNTTATAFGGLAAGVAVVQNAAEAGREAFADVAELDPALADALDGERSCQELRSEDA
jgi:hypothetical protein